MKEFTFRIPAWINMTVSDVTCAQHAVNRLRKLKRDGAEWAFKLAIPALNDSFIGQLAENKQRLSTIEINQIVTERASVEHVVNKPVYFSDDEQQGILAASANSRGVSDNAHSKLRYLLTKGDK